MVGDDFQKQTFGGRPGEGSACRQHAPRLQVGEIGCQRPHGVVAHAFAGQVLERRDVVVGEQLCKLIATIERQDRIERIQFLGAFRTAVSSAGWIELCFT